MKICKLLVAACCLLLGTSQAQATPLIFSKLSNFRVELTDLTPDDGVDAQIEWFESVFNSADNTFSPINGWVHLQDMGADLAPQYRDTVTSAGRAIADANRFTLASQVEVLSDQIVSQAVFAHAFILGANTRVTFSLDWHAQSVFDWPVLGSVGSRLFVDTGLIGEIPLVVKEMSFDNPGLVHDQLMLAYEAGESARFGQVVGGVISTGMNFSPYEPAAEVPEPGSAALLLAGAAAALAARRRRVAVEPRA
jgi:hypothetical protein